MAQPVAYSYRPLSDPSTDIRLINLPPGHFARPRFVVNIFDTPLKEREKLIPRINLEELAEEAFLRMESVCQPPEGGILILSHSEQYSWEHPNSDFEPFHVYDAIRGIIGSRAFV